MSNETHWALVSTKEHQVVLSAGAQRDIVAAIEEYGWAVTRPVVHHAVLERARTELTPLLDGAGRGGLRNLLESTPIVREIARSAPVRAVAESVLGQDCFAVRAILFDKTPGANWKVMWHQDLTIAVRARANVPGFGPWSEKEGVVHVQPPTELLEHMLAVRIHLDECNAGNGPVRVISGSHRSGRLSASAIDEWRASHESIDCLAAEGAILAFRPLILHASSPASVPAHRRVLHIEFAACQVPVPLEWFNAVV